MGEEGQNGGEPPWRRHRLAPAGALAVRVRREGKDKAAKLVRAVSGYEGKDMRRSGARGRIYRGRAYTHMLQPLNISVEYRFECSESSRSIDLIDLIAFGANQQSGLRLELRRLAPESTCPLGALRLGPIHLSLVTIRPGRTSPIYPHRGLTHARRIVTHPKTTKRSSSSTPIVFYLKKIIVWCLLLPEHNPLLFPV